MGRRHWVVSRRSWLTSDTIAHGLGDKPWGCAGALPGDQGLADPLQEMGAVAQHVARLGDAAATQVFEHDRQVVGQLPRRELESGAFVAALALSRPTAARPGAIAAPIWCVCRRRSRACAASWSATPRPKACWTATPSAPARLIRRAS